MKTAWAIFALASLSACSHQAWYDNIQDNNQRRCAKLPPSQYDECMERSSQPYEDYEQTRQEVVTAPRPIGRGF